MYARLKNYLLAAEARQRIAIGLARGAIARSARRVDWALPDTWEFGGLSQNGEDGIIDVLRGQLVAPGGTFLEIGGADGVQNNTAWLALVERLDGIMVEGDPLLAGIMCRVLAEACVGSRFLQRFVTRENARELLQLLPTPDPDLFSLDIDGNDYHIAQAMLATGLRPKIIVVEFNSVFGPDAAVTVPYRENFSIDAHASRLYYGASIGAWRSLFASHGYRFVTVERNGVNAFFADAACFRAGFLEQVQGRSYAENKYQRIRHGAAAEGQFEMIRHLPLERV
jgi:hypothetical protein